MIGPGFLPVLLASPEEVLPDVDINRMEERLGVSFGAQDRTILRGGLIECVLSFRSRPSSKDLEHLIRRLRKQLLKDAENDERAALFLPGKPERPADRPRRTVGRRSDDERNHLLRGFASFVCARDRDKVTWGRDGNRGIINPFVRTAKIYLDALPPDFPKLTEQVIADRLVDNDLVDQARVLRGLPPRRRG